MSYLKADVDKISDNMWKLKHDLAEIDNVDEHPLWGLLYNNPECFAMPLLCEPYCFIPYELTLTL